MVVDEDPREQERLVATLVDRFDLLGVATDACERAGIRGREQQVAYCLVVVSAKADPVRSSSLRPAGRTYDLDPAEAGFADRLAAWAATIAGNMRDWATVYEAIQDEFDRYEITTLRGLIRLSTGDDVIDAIADKLGAVLTGGQRLEDMSLELARETAPAGAEYAFQSPLSRWVATSARRDAPWDTDPIGPREEEELAGDDVFDEVVREIELRRELDLDVYRELVDRVAALADTQSLLPAAIGGADRLDRHAAGSRLASAADITLFQRLRAELAHVSDELRSEQRAFGGMLAYIVLAMGDAPTLQGVTILSLRLASLERPVIDHIARRMRAVIGDEQQPTPTLVSRTRRAVRAGVSRHRARALELLREAPEKRAAQLCPVTRLLDELPATVADLAAIGAALPKPISARTVATNRGQAASELKAVDHLYGRVFRRYAMGRT